MKATASGEHKYMAPSEDVAGYDIHVRRHTCIDLLQMCTATLLGECNRLSEEYMPTNEGLDKYEWWMPSENT